MGQDDKGTNNKRLFPSNTRQAKYKNENHTNIYDDDNGAWKLTNHIYISSK